MTTPNNGTLMQQSRAPDALAAMGGFAPQNLTQAMAMADMLGRSGVVPAAIRGKPSDILVVLLTGHEFGLAPMASLRLISVIEGKPIIGSEAYLSVVLAYEKCEFFRCVETTDKKATFEAKRHGEEKLHELTWTIEQAAKAKLLTKDNWQKYPEAMLRWRCISALAKLVFPERFAGVYHEDEADEVRASAAEAAPTQPENRDTADKLAERARAAKEAQTPASQAVVDAKAEEAKPQATPTPKPPLRPSGNKAEIDAIVAKCEALKLPYDGEKLTFDEAYRKAKADEVEKLAKRAAGAISESSMEGKPRDPPVDQKLPHQVADEKKTATEAEGPFMIYGGPEFKGKAIKSLTGGQIVDLMKLGNDKLKSLDEKKAAKVNENLAQLKSEIERRERKMLEDQEREPGADDDID